MGQWNSEILHRQRKKCEIFLLFFLFFFYFFIFESTLHAAMSIEIRYKLKYANYECTKCSNEKLRARKNLVINIAEKKNEIVERNNSQIACRGKIKVKKHRKCAVQKWKVHVSELRAASHIQRGAAMQWFLSHSPPPSLVYKVYFGEFAFSRDTCQQIASLAVVVRWSQKYFDIAMKRRVNSIQMIIAIIRYCSFAHTILWHIHLANQTAKISTNKINK